MNNQPKKGDIGICSLGTIGLITEDYPITITYKDGNQSKAYVGFHLTDKISEIGKPWSSRNPKIIGNIDSLIKNLK